MCIRDRPRPCRRATKSVSGIVIGPERAYNGSVAPSRQEAPGLPCEPEQADERDPPYVDTSLAILVVDDSKVDRTLLANMFSGSYSLLEARSGREALEIMAHEKVDVVVLDIGMKGMDGFEVISACLLYTSSHPV